MEKSDLWLETHAPQLLIGSMGVTAVGMLLVPLMAVFPPIGLVAAVGALGCFLFSINLVYVTMNRDEVKEFGE